MREGQGRGGAPVTAGSRPRLLLATSAAIALAADQVSKTIALATLVPGERVDLLGSLFGWLLVRNSGGAFSILPGGGALLSLLTAAIVVVVAVWGYRSGEFPAAFGLIIGGGLGNLADRILRSPGAGRGSVVDFIDLGFWPTFNLADVAITTGVGLLLLFGLTSRRR